MLNRNNLTLSALSNRLNLGTRSLVDTSVNNGTALRIRDTHHDVMRKHAGRHLATSISVEVCAIPPVTGPASAAAARLKQAWADAWKPDAADARLVPTNQAQGRRGWPGGQLLLLSGFGSGRLSSSRSRRSTAQAGSVETRRRPRPSLDAIETRSAAWESRAASRRSAIAAVAG